MVQSNSSVVPVSSHVKFYMTCLMLFAISVGGCSNDNQNRTASAAVNPEEERKELMALEREWSGMYGRGDVEGISRLLAEKTVLLVPGELPAVGLDSVLALTRELLGAEAADGMSASWEPEAAFISSSGDMAYDYGRSKTTLTDGSVVEGSYLVVWTKENGEWKVAADIFN